MSMTLEFPKDQGLKYYLIAIKMSIFIVKILFFKIINDIK